MNEIVNRLAEDHSNFLSVHRIITKEMSVFSEGAEQRNLPLLLDIMEYLKGYSETFHHSLEDRIYASIRTTISNPHISHMLDSIELQHAQLEVFSRRLVDDLNAIANHQVITTDRVLADFEAYIDLATEHIQCENKYLLPIITKVLSDSELERITQERLAVSALQDEKRAIYSRLFEQIMEESQYLEV